MISSEPLGRLEALGRPTVLLLPRSAVATVRGLELLAESIA